MSDQSYSNHGRMVTGYHKVGFTLLALTLIGAGWNLWISVGGPNFKNAILILTLTVVLVLVGYYARIFALKAQDRAIRAEENLRHYVQHGKLLPAALTMRQIIGIRFASDDEFQALAADAAEKGTSEDDIKKSIKNWKADTYRV